MTKVGWPQILLFLQKSLNPGLFSLWIKPLEGDCTDRRLTLTAPNDFVAAWVKERLLDEIRQAASHVLGREVEVRVGVASHAADTDSPRRRAEAAPKERQANRPMGLPIARDPGEYARSGGQQNWRFSFDDFVVGPSNELACAASRGLCGDVLDSASLFLASDPGLGKTHLVHAIGGRLCA